METYDANDPRGLIRESFRIDGITLSECRTIFLDWAISLPDGQDSHFFVRELLATYHHDNPGHPMIAVLTDALSPASKPVRRGGARGRRQP